MVADDGGPIYYSPTPGFLAAHEEDEDFDWGGPPWLCRYIDGHACFACGTVDLAVVDVRVLLEQEGRELPQTDGTCPVCEVPYRGPRGLECEGVPGVVLAFLKHNSGFVGLREPPALTQQGEPSGQPGRRVAGIMVEVCDSCGEARTLLGDGR